MTFKIGDVVRLNTGNSPVMTVIGIDEPVTQTRVAWFNGSWPHYEQRTAWFPSACLELYEALDSSAAP